MSMDIEAAIEEDHRLSMVADSAQVELARHRWHWTLDETNPERKFIREWASLVGVNESTIRRMVKGYELWGAAGSPRTLTDCIALVSLSSDRRSIALQLHATTGRGIEALRRDGSISDAYWASVESDAELADEEITEAFTETPYRRCQTACARIFAEFAFIRQTAREIDDDNEREKLAIEVALKAELLVSLVDAIRGANVDDELRAMVDDD